MGVNKSTQDHIKPYTLYLNSVFFASFCPTDAARSHGHYNLKSSKQGPVEDLWETILEPLWIIFICSSVPAISGTFPEQGPSHSSFPNPSFKYNQRVFTYIAFKFLYLYYTLPFVQSRSQHIPEGQNHHTLTMTIQRRPSGVGIKAMELYVPNRVSL